MSDTKAVATKPAPPADALETDLLALAKTPEERQRAYALASQARQADMLRRASAALAETGWGQNISPIARAAVARYMLEIGGDPARHCYVLGGNVYLNAEFYRDLCAANEDFDHDEVRFIHADARASKEEQAERAALRVQYAVPEDAPGAAIVTLHYKGRGPFVGVNWAGVRKNDPVGRDEPTKTAHSRAYRKAAQKAESAWFRTHPHLLAAEAVLTQGRVIETADEVADLPKDPQAERGRLGAGDPGVETEPPAKPKTVKHAPSKICPEEDYHPASECGYETKPAA